MSYSWVEGASLEVLVKDAIEGYARKYLGMPVEIEGFDDEQNAYVARVLFVFSSFAVDATANLSTPHLHALESLRGQLSNPLLRDTVHERLQVDAARRFSLGTEAMADRAFQLLELITEGEPTEPVLRFMRRVSRCYVAGFFPECVIQCRAVMENSVKARFKQEGLELPKKQESTMRNRLDFAVLMGWLTKSTKDDATTVWFRGSKAAHQDPDVTRDALDTIRRTSNVIRSLNAS